MAEIGGEGCQGTALIKLADYSGGARLGSARLRKLGRGFSSRELGRVGQLCQRQGEPGVSAPSEAWRFLPGASPGRGEIKEDLS